MLDFIIPAIDIKEGKVVRLYKGEFNKEKVYFENPEEVALKFKEKGFKRIHVIDLDGAKGSYPANIKALERIRKVFDEGEIEFGGGLRSKEIIENIFKEGVADYIIIGTLAIKSPELFKEISFQYPRKVILSIDSKGGKIAVEGWQTTASYSPLELVKKYDELPLWGYLYTIVERDGTLEGVDVQPYKEIRKLTKKGILASGGVSSLEDIKKLYGIVEGVVVGRAIYEGKIFQLT